MKRLFILTILSLVTIVSSAQSSLFDMISIDRVEADGMRQVMADDLEIGFDGAEYSITLKAYSDGESIDWALLFSSFYYIPDNAVVLVKLKDNTVMEFSVDNINVGSVTIPAYSHTIGSTIMTEPSREQDYYSAYFVISPEQMDTIVSKRVSKIRITKNAAYEYRENTIGAFQLGYYIQSARKAIEKRLSVPSKDKAKIWDNF